MIKRLLKYLLVVLILLISVSLNTSGQNNIHDSTSLIVNNCYSFPDTVIKQIAAHLEMYDNCIDQRNVYYGRMVLYGDRLLLCQEKNDNLNKQIDSYKNIIKEQKIYANRQADSCQDEVKKERRNGNIKTFILGGLLIIAIIF